MKSRQKFTVSEKHIHGPRNNEPDEYHLDLRVKKKISSNPLIQKNISFLQTYNNLFKKPSQQIGDAEAYFKQTLRSETFDLIRDLHLEAHLIKSVKSFENINKRKVRSKRTVLTPRRHSSRSFQSYQRPIKGTQKPLLEDKGEPSKQPLEAEKETWSVLKEDFVKELYSARQAEEVDISESESETETEEKEQEGDITPKVVKDLEERLDGILSTVDEDLDNIMEGEEGTADGENFETDLDVPVEEGDDEEIKAVEQMIDQAAEELQQVAEENQNLMQVLEEGVEGEEEDGERRPNEEAAFEGSTFKFDSAIDSAILKELDDAERQAKETANVIFQLKTRVGELAQKEQMTEKEAKELASKNKELEQLMILFEEKVKRIQQLIIQSNLFESMTPIQPTLQMRHKEDKLPQVLVCGITEENIPKIIVCDKKGAPSSKSKKDKTPRSPQTTVQCTPRRPMSPMSPMPPMSTMMPQEPQMSMFGQKLNECICKQEKLAAENANLEGTRYELQGELMNKDQTVESLQRQLFGLQAELRLVFQENCALNQKLQQSGSLICGPVQSGDHPASLQKQQRCGKGRSVCPADIESRLQEYSENTQNLERQLSDMENEVRAMQEELTAVQRERAHLEHHRKMMCPTPPCFLPPCIPPSCIPAPPCRPPPCMMPPPCPCDEDTDPPADQQMKELKEQYNLLQDDYKSKLKEVSTLRAENQNLKEGLEAERDNLKVYQDKIKILEDELRALTGDKRNGAGLKEQLMELEQQLAVAKQRFREAQDELEELRLLVQDQQQQISDYRNKYLEAQQQVEEQRRQIDLMEMENQRVSEQVNLEIQRVKNQFQEKVQELMPLPDILKSTQMKLQEAQQMHLLAERNNESIAREMKMYKDKLAALTNQLDLAKSDEALGKSEKDTLLQKIADLEKELEDMREENFNLRNQMADLDDKLTTCYLESDSRAHAIVQLESDLDNVREESARQVARTKDRCEIVRKSMQNQINDLERQLAQCRAQAKAAQKDRDEIRHKMQAQICNLNENFEDATMRIRSLQGHVNFLKNTYGVVTTDPCPKPVSPDPCNCGVDY